jgi:hypothetical protein
MSRFVSRLREVPLRCFRFLVVAVAALVTVSSGAGAQGFQVRPLFVDGEVPPGTMVEIPIEITPTSEIEGRTLEVEVVQLAQADTGAFRPVAYEPGSELARSAAPWIDVPDEIALEARQTTTLNVGMQVPIGARGSYAAAILLSAPPPPGAEGLRLTLRLLIPIVIGTEGRPARQDIRLADAELRYRFPEPEANDGAGADPDSSPETTMVDALIENNGGTFSRVQGTLSIDAKRESGEWRQIRRTEIDEFRLLPETAISLPVDLGRLLPGGDYRVRGELYVDGRRTPPLREEIAFDGHPSVRELATDIDIDIDPPVFAYEYRPGATRSGVIAVENPAVEPIEVAIAAEIPPAMAGRASATVRGRDLSAADWVELAPERFVLRPGQSRNVRLLARFPDSPAPYQNFYSRVALEAHYQDGQRAGAATSLIAVSRPDGEDRRAAEMQPARVSTMESPGDYAVAQRVTNVGNVLLWPTVEYVVADADGSAVLSGELSSDVSEPLLPLAARSFGGRLDLTGLPKGDFSLLTVLLDGSTEVAERTQTLRKDEAGGIIVETGSPE